MLEARFDVLVLRDGRWHHAITLYANSPAEARTAWRNSPNYTAGQFRVRRVKGYADRQLADIRGVLRGWAFAPAEWLPRRIEQAEALRDSLPLSLREQADALIAPLRDALANGNDTP